MGDLRSTLRHAALAGVLALGGAGACHGTPPKPPAPAVTPEPPPPPPPPKSCNTLEDACVAAADTRSPIAKSSWSLAPPPEWTYAHDADTLVAKTGEAAIAVTVHETGDKKTLTAKRAAALDLATHTLGLTAPKKKLVWPAKSAKVLTVGTVKVALYQFGGFTRDQKPGALLVFTSKLSATESLLGVGFVLENDTHDADKAILQAVESLRADAAADAPDAGAPR